jgi:type VI secretion system protein ImpA
MLDIESLLKPVIAEEAGGPNLEYSPEFADLERDVQGKPERQVGEVIVPAEEPDWRRVLPKAVALLGTSRDLRVATYLARAMLEVDGFAGFGEALTFLRRLVGENWTAFHPKLDADDGNDPTLRINAMAGLSHRDVINAVRSAALVKSKGFGDLRLRDIEGRTVKRSDGSAGATSLDTIFLQIPAADLKEAAAALDRCVAEAKGLDEAWAANLDGAGPNLTDLRRVLKQANDVVGPRAAAALETANGVAGHDAGSADGEPAARSSGPFGGEPRSREEVIRALDAICAYYARLEPSSPVPLLLERCKRLVKMSFIDIVKDMLPEGLTQVETIAGKPKE